MYHNVGRPFVEAVSLDDLVIDMTARNLEGAQYIGNRYRLPLWQVRDSGLFEDVGWLKADNLKDYDSSERVEEIQRGGDGRMEEYEEAVNLLDLWLPGEGEFVTYAEQDLNMERPLRVMSGMVPGTALPVPRVRGCAGPAVPAAPVSCGGYTLDCTTCYSASWGGRRSGRRPCSA